LEMPEEPTLHARGPVCVRTCPGSVLIGINVLVDAMVGQEGTVLPLLATETFGLTIGIGTTMFLVAFGLTKALGNLAAGRLADRPRPSADPRCGWLLMTPVPFMLAFAGSWRGSWQATQCSASVSASRGP
jgi:hypothetical protein